MKWEDFDNKYDEIVADEDNEFIKKDGFMRKLTKSEKQSIPVIVILLILFTFFMISSALKSDKPSSSSVSNTIDLKASIFFTGTQFVISNNDPFQWTNVKIKVNDDYILTIPTIEANNIYTVGALQFSKDDGTRFNPFQMKAKRFSIWCDTYNGKGFYYGEWN